MKNLKQTVLLSVVGLATIGTITGFALAGGDNKTGDTSESEVVKVDTSKIETSTETSKITTTYSDDIIVVTDFDYTVSKQNIINIHTIRLNLQYNRLVIYYDKLPDITPTGMIAKDEYGHIGTTSYYDNMLAGSDNLDISSKHYTITLEFANNPEIGDVTIEITLP